MDKCEWCGKKRYSNDDSTWIYSDYNVKGYRERFLFCCRGHASRFENETNYNTYDERKKCYYCSDKYYPSDGVNWHLRIAGNYRRYEYCSDECAIKHKKSDDYTWVDSNGFTKDEKARYDRKKRAEIQYIKAIKKEKNKSLWYKSIISHLASALLFLIGVFLICAILTSVLYEIICVFIFYILYYNFLRGKIKELLVGYFSDDRILDEGLEVNLIKEPFLLLVLIPLYIKEKFYEQIPVLFFTYKIFQYI